jgi:hypothetical protein
MTAVSPAPRLSLLGLLREWHEYDLGARLILIYVPVALAVLEYFFVASRSSEHLAFLRNPSRPVFLYLWYHAGCMVFMVAVPMLLGRLVGGFSPRDCGVTVRGTARDAPLYGLLYLLAIPMLLWASQQPAFTSLYPFYKPRGGTLLEPDYILFEATYFLQFFAVEYFFRGFIVLGLKRQLGRASVLVMLAPYCMMHFHKPFPEAIGAIGAGLLLGTLSWRNGTIVWGWFLHYAIGLSMNVLAHMAR